MTRHALTDYFLAEVWDRYKDAGEHSPRPAVEVADYYDAPVATVRRWINTARERGLVARPGHGVRAWQHRCPTCGASPSRQRPSA